jgi:hypothetical protein
MLVVSVASAGLAARASGTSLAPRDEVLTHDRKAAPPRMGEMRPSSFANELERLGLDPKNLPAFEELKPRQLRGVMSTFTRALGYACTDCHAASDYRVPTEKKALIVQM